MKTRNNTVTNNRINGIETKLKQLEQKKLALAKQNLLDSLYEAFEVSDVPASDLDETEKRLGVSRDKIASMIMALEGEKPKPEKGALQMEDVHELFQGISEFRPSLEQMAKDAKNGRPADFSTLSRTVNFINDFIPRSRGVNGATVKIQVDDGLVYKMTGL